MQQKLINEFVDFVRQYDVTSADYTKIFDEYTTKVEYEVESSINNNIVEMILENPHSVIITGNAGDGKTRICRNVYKALTNKDLIEWSLKGIEEVQFKGNTFYIVKDLSELTDERINSILNSLNNTIHKKNEFYIIAANEGKLTFSLYADEKLKELIKIIEPQFSRMDTQNEYPLKVYNLLHCSSSIYADKIIASWNEEKNWEICKKCSLKNRCIIHHNHLKLANDKIQKRVIRLYKTLDTLDVHMTMRELLIQLAYVHLGGLNCRDIHKVNASGLIYHADKVYYQNLYGLNIELDVFNEIPGVNEIRKFDPGKFSNSVIDDFILNGDLAEPEVEKVHKELFGNEIDTNYGYYKKDFHYYRVDKNNNQQVIEEIVEKWLPRLRRKYFFEAEHRGYKGENLIPYKTRKEFIQILSKKENSFSLTLKQKIVQGLNNYFANNLVFSPEHTLYVVSEKLYVYRTISFSNIKWIIEDDQLEFDRASSCIYIDINNVKLKLDFSVFEYLCRLAEGGLRHILHDDVEIRLQNFKNQLIAKAENTNMLRLQILKYIDDYDAYSICTIEIHSNEENDNDDEDDEW